jgi:hypothetical protein
MEATIEKENPTVANLFNKLVESSFLGNVTITTGAECAGNWINAEWNREPAVDPRIYVHLMPYWEWKEDILIQPTLTETLTELWGLVDAYLQSEDNPRDESHRLKKVE